MRAYIHQKIHGPHLVILCQLIIMLLAFIVYFSNRGNAYEREFLADEYQLADYAKAQDTVTVDQSNAASGVFMRTPELSLEKGIYRIQVNYNASQSGNTLQAVTSQLSPINWNSTPAQLDPGLHTAHLTLELNRAADDVRIETSFSGSGSLEITYMGIYETSNYYKQNIFYALLLCALIALVYYFTRCDRSVRRIILALGGIFLVSCYPLFTDHLLAGHDLPFHLLRIEGIAAGLSQGIFPVKIHPVWAQDYGYAVGVFYGDTALYFPALLRLLGFPIQTAYQYFVAAMQLGTVLVSYFTFRRMFASSKIGLLGSLLYSLALYRLFDVYTRASVGEFTAMLFFPVVFCGFYLIFTESDKSNYWKHAILTALGLTGLIQSHILSCEMTILFVIITCLVLIRLVVKLYKFLALALGAFLTVLMNLGFLVPFLNYFNENIMIHSDQWTGSTNGAIQDTGLLPVQMFTLFQKSNGGTWSTLSGVYNEATFGMGIAFLIGAGLFLYLLLCYRRETSQDRNFLPACFSFGLGLLALWMSTCYFPWDALADASPILDKLIVSVEFPWRLLAPATVLLTFVSCFALSKLPAVCKEHQVSLIAGTCLILLFVNIGWYYYDFSFTGNPYRVYDTYELNTMAMYSYDYLPAGTDPQQIRAGRVFSEGIESLTGYAKEGTTILCHATTGEDSGWIDFPLNYYEHYTCRTLQASERLTVSAGTNNMVRVTVPPNFSGAIELSFTEPWYWRLSEIISLLTLLVCLAVYCGNRFKKQLSSNLSASLRLHRAR